MFGSHVGELSRYRTAECMSKAQARLSIKNSSSKSFACVHYWHASCMQQMYGAHEYGIAEVISCARRRFVASVLSRLVRLSYWSRVHSVVPATFHALLPPEPKVRPCFCVVCFLVLPGGLPRQPCGLRDGLACKLWRFLSKAC
jgi:hypothetical protein